MLNRFHIYITQVITKKRKGICADFLRGILFILSFGFCNIVKCRNWAVPRGWLRTYSPPVPLISIGNVVAGGTGKTPATLLVAQALHENYPLAVLSRGYRSHAEHLRTPLQINDGNGPLYSAAYCGDEPYLLAQNLPNSFIFVGKNRRKSSLIAAKAGAKLILLDDGMQHRSLARNLELVVVDSNDPFGQGYCLPRGFLREGIDSLARADLILLNHIQSCKQFVSLKNELEKYTTAPFVGTKMEVVDIYDLFNVPIDSIKGKRVGIFCGIAHPEYFQKTVEGLGGCIVASHFFPDHLGFNSQNLSLLDFSEKCRTLGAEMLLCTEKDKVKLNLLVPSLMPIAWIKMRMAVVEGSVEWESFIKKAKAFL